MIKGFEDAFTDLQSEFVSLCMEYTNGSVDKIYIYIYQDTSQKMFNAIFVKGDRSYLPVILLMMKPLMNFYQLEQKILVS